MEIRQLHYFLKLCNELHFSEAAYQLGISQPTLSQQIRVLEDEVGVPLFDRMGKKTEKTEAGAILEHYAMQAVRQLENAKQAIADLTAMNAGSLRVAVLPSDLDYRLTALLIEFHKEFPRTKVQVVPSLNIVNQVLDNEVDIGVGLSAKPDSRLHRTPFYTETYSLYIRQDHPLAERNVISVEDLGAVPLVMYPKGFYGRDLIDAWCLERQTSIDALMETGSAASLFQLVQAGIGGTIQPSRLIESLRSTDIRSVPIQDSPVRDLEIVYRNDKYVSLAAKTFIRRLETFFQGDG
ncbi:LysR family transcriptional regulator [Paenibacillus hodogayensis]|uniref:LysR family transcriptional regulator n=1 Tax=Paenibacillus hodogayensis TaxID=279208 RepID=A0ABV5VVY0_9BACL